MQSCELIMAISTLACWISQDRSPDEIKQISNIYRQLSNTLDSIALQNLLCEIISKKNSEDDDNDNDEDDNSNNAENSEESENSIDSDCPDDIGCPDDLYDCDDFYDSKNPECY